MDEERGIDPERADTRTHMQKKEKKKKNDPKNAA